MFIRLVLIGLLNDPTRFALFATRPISFQAETEKLRATMNLQLVPDAD